MANKSRSRAKQAENHIDFDEMSPLEREECLIRMSERQIFERINSGTATAQELVHYAKLGSSRERLEQENKELENQLLEAKTEMIQAARQSEEMYAEVIEAMRSYAGYDE